jgi:hypothetical protein
VDVLARFPARPGIADPKPSAPTARSGSEQADHGSQRLAKPTRQPATRHRDRRAKSVFPTRSVMALAVVAAGIWGLALRNELVRRSADPVELAETDERASHRIASDPGTQGATQPRITQ